LIGQAALDWTSFSVWRYGCEEFVKTGRIAGIFWARSALLVPNLLLLMATSLWWLGPVADWLRIPPPLAWLVLGHLAVTAVWIHVQRGLQATKLIRLHSWLLVVERGAVLLMVGVVVFAGTPSVFSVTAGYLLGAGLAFAAGLWRLWRLVYPGVRVERDSLRRVLYLSLPLLPYSLLGVLSTNHVDAIFITAYLPVAALGVYAVAYLVCGTLMQLPLHAGSLALPYFVTLRVNDQQERVVQFLRKVLPLMTLAWSAACGLSAVIGVYFLPLLFGSEFAEGAPLLWPLMASAALAGPWLMGYAPAFNARSMTYVGATAGILASATNLTLNALLIPVMGLAGCAWATTGAYAVMTLIGAWFMFRHITPVWGGAVLAALPAVLGAAYATWRKDHLGGLTVTLVTALVIAFVLRATMTTGLGMVRRAVASR
jgi:O-antigen/teichoic acid export membrane protein